MAEIIYASATLSCGQAQAFEFFTRSDRLESWLTSHAEVEPKVGGRFELFWNPNDRANDSTIGCKFTSVDKPKFVGFTWRGPKEFKRFMNEVDPLTHVSVMFVPLGTAESPQTEVHLIHSGWRNSPEWQAAREYFVRNWTTAFRNLEREARQT